MARGNDLGISGLYIQRILCIQPRAPERRDYAVGAAEAVDAVTPALERKLLSRRLLLTTKTLENAIAAPAMTGFR